MFFNYTRKIRREFAINIDQKQCFAKEQIKKVSLFRSRLQTYYHGKLVKREISFCCSGIFLSRLIGFEYFRNHPPEMSVKKGTLKKVPPWNSSCI